MTLTLAQGVAGAVDMHVLLLHRRLHHQRQLREVPSTRHMYLLFRLAQRRLKLVQHVCGHQLCMKRCQLNRYWHFRQIPPIHFPTAAPHNKAPVAVGEFVGAHVGVLGRLVGVLPEVDGRFVARLVVGGFVGTRVVVLGEFVQGKAPGIVGELVGTRVVVLGRLVVPLQAADCRLVARLVVADGSVGALLAVDYRLVPRAAAAGKLVVMLPVVDYRPVARLEAGCIFLDAHLVVAGTRCAVGYWHLPRRGVHFPVVRLLRR